MKGNRLVLLLVGALASAARGQERPLCSTCSAPILAAANPSGGDSRVAELEKVDAERDRAALKGDKAAVSAMSAEELVFVTENGDVLDKAQVLSRVSALPPSMKAELTAANVQVRLLGDTAVVTSKKTIKWEMNGRPDSNQYRETNTYVRRGGRWLLAASQRQEDRPPYVAKDVAFDFPFEEARVKGNKKAAVVLYEFSDYECDFCRRFAKDTLARLEKEYVTTGRVALIFRNYPMAGHAYAFGAAAAGECAAAGGKFWAMNQRLFQDPMELSPDQLKRNAREIGLDAAQFARCVQDPTTAERVRRDMKDGDATGMRGTPNFIVGVRKPGETTVRAIRMIEGAYPYEVFKATLDGLIRARD